MLNAKQTGNEITRLDTKNKRQQEMRNDKQLAKWWRAKGKCVYRWAQVGQHAASNDEQTKQTHHLAAEESAAQLPFKYCSTRLCSRRRIERQLQRLESLVSPANSPTVVVVVVVRPACRIIYPDHCKIASEG